MSYVDQDMTGNRVFSAVAVAIMMVGLGYALVSGFAVSTAKKILEATEVIEIEEEEPEPEDEPPPPPPEKQAEPPPVVAPQPKFETPAPDLPAQEKIPDNFKPTEKADPVPDPGPAVKPTPPPPPKPVQPNPRPRNNSGTWVTTNDYPSSAMRRRQEGTTRVTLTVGTNGRVSDCRVSSSSGHDSLDKVACRQIQRRARFRPALDANSQPMSGTYSFAVRWQVPE